MLEHPGTDPATDRTIVNRAGLVGYLSLVDIAVADDHATATSVTARCARDIPRYCPGRHTADIAYPLLFALSDPLSTHLPIA